MTKSIRNPSNLKTVKFDFGGFDEYLKKVQAAGNSVDDACAEAVEEIKEGVRADIQTWANKHDGRYTGAVAGAVNATEVQRSNGEIWADVGIDGNLEYGAWHAVFIEYGTPKIPADPGIRETFRTWKPKAKKIIQRVLEKWGVPHG